MDERRKRFEADNWVESGKSWIKRCNLDKAEYSLKKALDIVPSHKEAITLLENIYELRQKGTSRKQKSQVNKQELDEARRFLTETISRFAIEISSEYCSIFGPVGQVYVISTLIHLQRFQEAEKICRSVLHSFPESTFVSGSLTLALKCQEKCDEALEQARRTLELNPKISTEYQQTMVRQTKALVNVIIGDIHNDSEQFVDAVAAFREATHHDPSWLEPWTKLGTTLFQLKEFQEAEVVLRRAIEIDPLSDSLWLSLATDLQELGRESEAQQAADRGNRLRKQSGR